MAWAPLESTNWVTAAIPTRGSSIPECHLCPCSLAVRLQSFKNSLVHRLRALPPSGPGDACGAVSELPVPQSASTLIGSCFVPAAYNFLGFVHRLEQDWDGARANLTAPAFRKQLCERVGSPEPGLGSWYRKSVTESRAEKLSPGPTASHNRVRITVSSCVSFFT